MLVKNCLFLTLLACAYSRVANNPLKVNSNDITNENTKDHFTSPVSTTTTPLDKADLTVDLPVFEHKNETTEIIECNNISNDGDQNCLDNYLNLIILKEVNKTSNGEALILTPYIKEGRIEDARIASKVNKDVLLGFESYTGFFTVNETYNSNTFFWYFPVADKNKKVNETPWIIWMNGGPGASSLAGLFDEIGPVTVDKNFTLKVNQYSWGQNFSLLFIDNPVGTGFSYTNSKDGFVSDRYTYGAHLYSAVDQFLHVFPELRDAPLFIAGESYAGKYVPALAMEIHKRKGEKPGINLEGLLLGNALVEPRDLLHRSQIYYNIGSIDAKGMKAVQPLEEALKNAIKNKDSVKIRRTYIILMSFLQVISNQKNSYNFAKDDLEIGQFIHLMDRNDFKKAIHVGDIKYTFVNTSVNIKMEPDFGSDFKPDMEMLLENYRVLSYCGQFDQMLPCTVLRENRARWRWSRSQEFANATRYPWINGRTTFGYQKSGGGLTEVLIRGAGHMVPLDAPEVALQLITNFITRSPLYGVTKTYLRSVPDAVLNYAAQLNIDNSEVMKLFGNGTRTVGMFL